MPTFRRFRARRPLRSRRCPQCAGYRGQGLPGRSVPHSSYLLRQGQHGVGGRSRAVPAFCACAPLLEDHNLRRWVAIAGHGCLEGTRRPDHLLRLRSVPFQRYTTFSGWAIRGSTRGMMARHAQEVELSEAQRRALVALTRRRTSTQALMMRARIVLACAVVARPC